MITARNQGRTICLLFLFVILKKKMCTTQNEVVNIWSRENKDSAFSTNIRIYNDTFGIFKTSFLEKNTTQILLKYDTDNTMSTHVTFIYTKQNIEGFHLYFICFRNATNSTIQCDKHKENVTCNNDVSSCSGIEIFGIKWKNSNEYMESAMFENNTRNCSNRENVTYYKFNDSVIPSITGHTSGSQCIANNTNSSLDKPTSNVGIISGIVVSFIAVIVVIVILVIWKKKKAGICQRGSSMNQTNTKRENFYIQRALHICGTRKNKSKKSFQASYLQSQTGHKSQTGHESQTGHKSQTGHESQTGHVSHTDHISQTSHVSHICHIGENGFLKHKLDEKSVNNYDYPVSLVESDYASISEGHDELQLFGSKVDNPEDNYNYIKGDIPNRDSGVSDFNNIYHTVSEGDEIDNNNQNRSHDNLHSYNNIDLEKKPNDLKPSRNEYSKLREKTRSFENTYGELNQSPVEEVIKESDNALSNTYFILTGEEYEIAKNVMDK